MKKKYFWALESRKLIFRSEILIYPLILKILKKHGNGGLKILDTGCGTGKLTEILFSRGFDVSGIDKSEKAIEIAKSKNDKINYKVGDITKLSKEYRKESFNIVVSTFATLYLNKSQLSKFFNEVKKVLKKQGLCVFADIHPFLPVIQPKTRWEKWRIKDMNYFETQKVKQIIFLPKDIQGIKRIPFSVEWYHHPLFRYLDISLTAGFKLEKLYEPKVAKTILTKYRKMWGKEINVPVYFVLQLRN